MVQWSADGGEWMLFCNNDNGNRRNGNWPAVVFNQTTGETRPYRCCKPTAVVWRQRKPLSDNIAGDL